MPGRLAAQLARTALRLLLHPLTAILAALAALHYLVDLIGPGTTAWSPE